MVPQKEPETGAGTHGLTEGKVGEIGKQEKMGRGWKCGRARVMRV